MRAQYDSGLTAGQIAAEHGVDRTTVTRYLRWTGLTILRRGPRNPKRGVAEPERAAEFRRRYEGGETLQQIADDHGLTRERVRQILRKIGVPSLGHRPEHCQQPYPLTDAEVEAAKLYDAGTPPRELMARFSLTYSQIIGAVRRMGFEVKGVRHWNTLPNDAEITAQVCDLYRAGKAATEIVALVPSLKFPETVYRYLKKGGVPVRTRRGRFRERRAA